MGYSQVVRQGTLTLSCVGSNPATPVKQKRSTVMKQIFDEFLNEYLNKQDKTVRTKYEKAKEELLEK